MSVLSWFSANTTCASWGMRLPNNVDKGTTTQILQRLASYTAVTIYADYIGVNGWWLGLNCLATTHSWVWQDGSPLAADTRFGNTLPSQTYSYSKCAQMQLWYGWYEWESQICDAAANRVVCMSTSRLLDGYRATLHNTVFSVICKLQ